MVQIKLSVAFILVVSFISPVVALPAKRPAFELRGHSNVIAPSALPPRAPATSTLHGLLPIGGAPPASAPARPKTPPNPPSPDHHKKGESFFKLENPNNSEVWLQSHLNLGESSLGLLGGNSDRSHSPSPPTSSKPPRTPPNTPSPNPHEKGKSFLSMSDSESGSSRKSGTSSLPKIFLKEDTSTIPSSNVPHTVGRTPSPRRSSSRAMTI